MSGATRCQTQTLVIASIVRCLFASAWRRASSVWRVWGLLRVQLLLSPRLPLFLLVLVEFSNFAWIDGVYDLGLMMGLIPLVCCVRGRWWPYLQLLPITLLPIAGKTLRSLVYRAENPIDLSVGWLAYLILPMLLATTFAVSFARKAGPAGGHTAFIRNALLFCTWMYFGLNFAFFGFPFSFGEELLDEVVDVPV